MATPKEKTYSRYEIMEGYLSRVGIDLRLPYVGKVYPVHIHNLDVNPKAFPGFSTSRKIAKYRKDSSAYTKDYAYKYAQHIMSSERQILDTSVITVGGREKLSTYNIDEKGKNAKTRITCMGEDIPTLISQLLVNPITNCTPEIPDHFSQLAKVYGEGNIHRMLESMKPTSWQDVIADLDFSGHDNNVSECQIVAGFALIRLCFEESEEIDRLFYYSMSSMIYKRLVLPDSNMVYQINKGISSGHGFTSLMTTICSYGTLATSIFRCVDKSYYSLAERNALLNTSRILNAGDDVNMRINSALVLPIYEDVIQNSGHKIDDIRNNGYYQSNNVLSRVTLFKKQFQDFS